MFCTRPQSVLRPDAHSKHAMRFLVATLLAIVSLPALAHHPLDGKMMTTFWHGFLSGMAHPVLGMDHLVFIATIGVSAAFARKKLTVGGCALLGVFAGVALTLGGVVLPKAEFIIALSLIVLGGVVLFGNQSFDRLLIAVAGLFGVFHGSVYALVLVEQQALLVPVVAGFVVALPVVYAGVLVAGRLVARFFKRFPDSAFGPARVLPVLSMVLGVSLLAS